VSEIRVQFTRTEVAEHAQPAFSGDGLTDRADVLKAMFDSGAPQPMIGLVGERLPQGTRMREMRALWHYLGDLPLDRATP
jgi:hypothetical protein